MFYWTINYKGQDGMFSIFNLKSPDGKEYRIHGNSQESTRRSIMYYTMDSIMLKDKLYDTPFEVDFSQYFQLSYEQRSDLYKNLQKETDLFLFEDGKIICSVCHKEISDHRACLYHAMKHKK